MITLEILVPAYIKQYLISNYGDCYNVTYSDEFGSLVLQTLKRKSNHSNLQPFKNKNLETYSIKISMSYFEKSGCHIFEKDMIIIAKSLDKWFRNSLYKTAIINYEMFNIPYKTTISNYLLAYGVTEDSLSYATIRKDFNRKKESIRSKMTITKGQKI